MIQDFDNVWTRPTDERSVDEYWENLESGEPFHPLHVAVDGQGQGRFDNPHRYVALYGSTATAGAVGEAFGNLARWPGRRRAAATARVATPPSSVGADAGLPWFHSPG